MCAPADPATLWGGTAWPPRCDSTDMNIADTVLPVGTDCVRLLVCTQCLKRISLNSVRQVGQQSLGYIVSK